MVIANESSQASPKSTGGSRIIVRSVLRSCLHVFKPSISRIITVQSGKLEVAMTVPKPAPSGGKALAP